MQNPVDPHVVEYVHLHVLLVNGNTVFQVNDRLKIAAGTRRIILKQSHGDTGGTRRSVSADFSRIHIRDGRRSLIGNYDEWGNCIEIVSPNVVLAALIEAAVRSWFLPAIA